MRVKQISIMVFYNKKGQLLLQERKSFSKYGDDWGFFGGGIEQGENHEQAIIREIDEELKLDLNHDCFDYNYVGQLESVIHERQTIYKKHIYICETDILDHEFTVFEGEFAKYFHISEIQYLNIPPSMLETLPLVHKHLINKCILQYCEKTKTYL